MLVSQEVTDSDTNYTVWPTIENGNTPGRLSYKIFRGIKL